MFTQRIFKKIVLFSFFAVCATLAIIWWRDRTISYSDRLKNHTLVIHKAREIYGVDLVDPEESPPKNHLAVIEGYHFIQFTKKLLPEYAGDYISCSNCHFNGGDTLGGRANGISLVGVTSVYPKLFENNRSITLAQRINLCFERSLNGKALPEDSREMRSILAYLSWISNEVKDLKSFPWLGMNMIPNSHKPNSLRGQTVYQLHCALCHGNDGSGHPDVAPPLWGDRSFNDGAGMSKMPMLASFVHWNMPFDEPLLSEEDAWDVSAFILTKPRPHLKSLVVEK